jgi:hypothetical protein
MDVVDKIGNVATGARGPFKEDSPIAARGHRENRARRRKPVDPRPSFPRPARVTTLFISDLHIDAAARRSPSNS